METRLIARVAEVVTLDRSRAAAAAGRGGAVLLTGEPGIGKTAVVEEAVARATAAGVAVRTGRAEPDEGAPAFWPWRRLLAGAPGRLSPALLDPGSGAGESPAAARFRVIHTTVAALRSAAAGSGGLVLVLEDLQWADPASLALLTALCREITDIHIQVIGTARRLTGAPLADLAALPAVDVLRLAPLEPAAVGAWLAAGAAEPVHGSWTAVVHRLSGGNPLYVRELARLLAREDRLRRPATEVDLPDDLRRLVARRTGQLSPAAHELLGGAAALGSDLDAAVLRAAAPDPAAVDGLLAEAVAAGVLSDDPWRPAALRFAHDLVRQARYADLSRTERIAWHRRIADALGAAGAEPGEVARHRVRAAVDDDGRRVAAQACVTAARAAERGLDNSGALTWYARALECRPGDPALLLGRAGAAYRDGRLDVALADCAAVTDLAESRADGALAAEAALVVRGLAGPHGPALSVLCERALALLTDRNDPARARVLAQYAFLLAENGDRARAEGISREAMVLAERSGRADVLAAAIHARHEVIEPIANLAEVLDLADRSCALSDRGGPPDAELWGRCWRIDTMLTLGDLPGFEAELHRLERVVDRLGWPVARWHLTRVRAVRELLHGRFDAAERYATEARDLGTRAQDETAYWLYLALVGGLAAYTGEFGRSTGEIDTQALRFTDAPVVLAQLNRVVMLRGDRAAAEQSWPRLRATLPALPYDRRRIYIVATAGEVAAWLGDLDVVRECAAQLTPYGHLFLNNATGCYGSIARVRGVLASALGEHDDACRLLAEAVRMEERIGAVAFAAQARIAYAEGLLARGGPGDRPHAQRLAEQAAASARRLGLRRTLERAKAVGGELLTARELQIAELVADGHANRVVAEKLVLSERTVETHVRNVLAKLGLHNRTQLAARLRGPAT